MEHNELVKVPPANVSTRPTTSLQKLSPPEVSIALANLLAKTQRRYLNQQLGQAAAEYLEDFEILAQRYSLQRIGRAIQELRLNPNQRFFPAPNEVVAEILKQLEEEERQQREEEKRARELHCEMTGLKRLDLLGELELYAKFSGDKATLDGFYKLRSEMIRNAVDAKYKKDIYEKDMKTIKELGLEESWEDFKSRDSVVDPQPHDFIEIMASNGTIGAIRKQQKIELRAKQTAKDQAEREARIAKEQAEWEAFLQPFD
ncbi:MAG: hypothetical protein ACLP00_02515 [Terracidiphilus sp.]